MVFTHTAPELRRRKVAYYSLVLGILFGYFTWSILFHLEITYATPLCIALIFGVLGLVSFKSINSLTSEQLHITDSTIEKSNQDKREVYCLHDISLLSIKRRRNGITREIMIHLRDGKSIYINAFEKDFPSIEAEIKKRVSRDTKIVESREVLDLDSPAFYPSLGLIISLLFVKALQYCLEIDLAKVKNVFFILAAAEVCLGVHFILTRPISRHMGNGNILYDYLMGTAFLLVGILIPIVV